MSRTFQICNAKIHPGEKANLALPLPELYTCTSMHMPIKVFHSTEPGPCVLIFAAASGVEMNGLEIINRLLTENQLDSLKGTLITVPVLNVYGMLNYPQQLPQAFDIEGCFPGDEHGTFGERIAHVFTTQLLSKVDYCIELNTGAASHNITPQVYCNFGNQQSKRMAQAFGAPVIIDVPLEGNKLRQTTESLNIPLIVFESGEALRFSESDIQLGLAGIKRVLHRLAMLPQDNEEEALPMPLFAQDHDWIRAPKGGIMYTEVTLGQRIKKKQVIGRISDPFSADLCEQVASPYEGIVVGINQTPLVCEGESLFKVASFLDNKQAESWLESWDEEDGTESTT